MSDPTFRAGFDVALEAAINTALQYDPATRARLQALDGRILALDLTAPQIQCYLCIAGGQVYVRQQEDGGVTTRIGGSAISLVRLLKDPDATPAALGVSISGSSTLLAELQGIMRDLDIDWEAPLAQVLGDIPAHTIGTVLRGASSWLSVNLNRAPAAAAETISEEWQLTPPQAAFEAFVEDLAELSLATERLEARVCLLQVQFAHREAE